MTKFIKIICYVGKDIKYGRAAIDILQDRNVICIAGETAYSIPLLNTTRIGHKSPWEIAAYNKLLLDKSVLGINCGFDYIIPKEVLKKHPIINIHPAFLSYNKGCHHSFWGIMDDTPLGATIHWMTEELDAGPIIDQISFDDDKLMTAHDIQVKSDGLCLKLLNENIEGIMNGQETSKPQGKGTYHSKKDIIKASTLHINDMTTVKHLYKLCRATCNKDNGFIIDMGTHKVKIIVKRIEEEKIWLKT